MQSSTPLGSCEDEAVPATHSGGVVDNEEGVEGAAEGGEVLHEEGHARAGLAGHAQAAVAVQPVREVPPLRVQNLQQRLRVALHV